MYKPLMIKIEHFITRSHYVIGAIFINFTYINTISMIDLTLSWAKSAKSE